MRGSSGDPAGRGRREIAEECGFSDASYFGKIVKKPYIGDALRPAGCEDIRRANRLMYRTAWLGEILCLALMAAAALIFEGK